MKIHLSPDIKLYLKSLPKMVLAAVLGCWIISAIVIILVMDPLDAFRVIPFALFFFTIISHAVMWPAIFIIYLPIALYLRNRTDRAFILPALGTCSYATFPIWVNIADEPLLSRNPFFFWIALAIGFCVGLIHHFLMRKRYDFQN